MFSKIKNVFKSNIRSDSKKEALYTSIDSSLKSLILERSNKEGKSIAETVEELLYKGLEAERIKLDSEKMKEGLLEHDGIKKELNDLKLKYERLSKIVAKICSYLQEEVYPFMENEISGGMDRLFEGMDRICKMLEEREKCSKELLEKLLEKKEGEKRWI